MTERLEEGPSKDSGAAEAQHPKHGARQGLSLLFVCSAVLPLVGYLLSIGTAEAKRWGAPTIEVAIEGFDPRDPIRGHYLSYRIAVDQRANRLQSGSIVCVTPPQAGVSAVFVVKAGEPPTSCAHRLPTDFALDTHRYYVQQDKGRQLEEAVIGGRATVKLRLIDEHEVMVDALHVDGRDP